MNAPDLPAVLLNATSQLTADIPGIGGIIKQQVDDFVVEEIPAYEPSGTGEHLYLWIEKRDMGAEFFQRQIAQRLSIGTGEVGTAGMKDRRAVTTQWVSVPAIAESRVHQLEGDGIRVLKVSRHGNKLRAGHLRGNRFRTVIRDVTDNSGLERIIAAIQQSGLPNYYGSQRFGKGMETLRIGWDLLHGARVKVGFFLRKLALSAVQSALFNHTLDQRLKDGLFRTVLDGDVMAKWPAGGMFVTHDVAAEQPRFDAREIVHTGPMFGSKMRVAEGQAHQREMDILSGLLLTQDQFRAGGKLLEGTRRHNVIYVDELDYTLQDQTVTLRFVLPAGSYATVLLSEIMKSQQTAPADGD